jgi:NifB/MoaA-like Fe-S oxidoreductase
VETRKKMLNNRFAGDILEKLKKLADGKIVMETQVVLVPNVNDGALLEKTILDLHNLKPYVKSVAVVPCGITAHRDGLYKIENASKGYCKCVIEQVRLINHKLNENFVVLGDEFYFKAGISVEDASHYGEFSQLGNGVGTTAKFEKELNACLKQKKHKAKYLVVCGESASSFIASKIQGVKNYVLGLEADVLSVQNDFFGKTVNCTGLLVGRDVINALKKYAGQYDCLLVPNPCLMQFENIFLDDVTFDDLEEQLKMKAKRAVIKD